MQPLTIAIRRTRDLITFSLGRYIDLYRDVSDLERRNMSAMISALDVGVGATVADLNSTGMWSSTLMTVQACISFTFILP